MKRIVVVVIIIIGLVVIGVVFQLRHDATQSTPEPGYNTAVFLGINGTREALGLPTNPPIGQTDLRQNAIDTAMAPTRTPVPTHTAVPSRTAVPNQATRVHEGVNEALLTAGRDTLTPGPGDETLVHERVNATLQYWGIATLTPNPAG